MLLCWNWSLPNSDNPSAYLNYPIPQRSFFIKFSCANSFFPTPVYTQSQGPAKKERASYKSRMSNFMGSHKMLLATVIEGDQKAPVSIATTPRCRGWWYSFPLICTFYCRVLRKEVSSTILKVFGMMRPGIEPRSPGPLANTLSTRPPTNIGCYTVLQIVIIIGDGIGDPNSNAGQKCLHFTLC